MTELDISNISAMKMLHTAIRTNSTPIPSELLTYETVDTADGRFVDFHCNSKRYRERWDMTDLDRKADENFDLCYSLKRPEQRVYDQCMYDLGKAIVRSSMDTCKIIVDDRLICYVPNIGLTEYDESYGNDIENIYRQWHIMWQLPSASGPKWFFRCFDDGHNPFHRKLEAFKWLALKAFTGDFSSDDYAYNRKFIAEKNPDDGTYIITHE